MSELGNIKYFIRIYFEIISQMFRWIENPPQSQHFSREFWYLVFYQVFIILRYFFSINYYIILLFLLPLIQFAFLPLNCSFPYFCYFIPPFFVNSLLIKFGLMDVIRWPSINRVPSPIHNDTAHSKLCPMSYKKHFHAMIIF